MPSLPMTGAGPSAGVVGDLVYDTFVDANGTALSSHTPDIDVVGGGWSYDAGSAFTINSNQLDIGPAICRAIIDAGAADVKITGTLTTTGDDNLQVLVRFQDSDNYIRCVFELIPVGSIFIQKCVGASWTTVDNLVTGLYGAQTIDFEITAVGTTITMKDLTNDKTVSGTVSEGQSNTIVGLGDLAAETGPIVVDNFRVVNE